MLDFKVVLVEPEIPSNTGNIGRTCVATKSSLHLVEPLGFQISDSRLKRAGLDYWTYLNWQTYPSFSDWEKLQNSSSELWFLSTKGKRSLYDAPLRRGATFVFGSETSGLNAEILQKYSKKVLKIPLLGQVRSLNLSNSVSIVLYEALRQNQDGIKNL